MSNWGIIVVSRPTKLGEINEIVGHNEASNFETAFYGANRVRGDYALHSKLVQSVNVCAIVHFVRRN